MNGEEVPLSIYEGTFLLIEGMTTWCESCKAEIDPLKQVAETFGEKIILLAIAVDLETDTPEKLDAYKEEYDLSWDVVLDHKQQFANYFGITSYPTLLVFDAEGNLAEKWVGYTPASTMIDEISEHLGTEDQGEGNNLSGLIDQLRNNPFFAIFILVVVLAIVFKGLGKLSNVLQK
jgi:thiol-disulfide isomerase/thioredoxin